MQIVEIINNKPVISHRVIADNTDNQQKNVVELISKYYDELKSFGDLPFKTETVKNSVGAINEKKIYFLNEQQATLLITFMRNTRIVIDFKVKLVSEFFKMREFIQNLSNLNRTKVNLNDTKIREAFFIAFDGKCYYSGETLSKTHFHIDHILPKSKGGEDILCNLVVCKPDVNIIKSDNYDKKFVQENQLFVSQNFAPKIEAILNLIDENSKNFDLKYLFNAGVMNKLEELYGREIVKSFYAKLIPNFDYKKSRKIEEKTTEYFIKNCVIYSKNARLQTSKLYESYIIFCKDNQISAYTKIKFFETFRNIKKAPKTNLLKMSYFEGKKERYFDGLEVVF
jgi:phage regulator Rha-like protein